MSIFKNNLTKRIFDKTVAIALIIAFAGSVVFTQTVKADFKSSLNEAFQTFVGIGNNESTTSTSDIVEELPMKEWVLQQVALAGLNPKEAETIINCESRWEPDAMGFNQNHTADLGLWQINSIHKDISNADKLDYKKATEWAIEKRMKDGHWRAWSCSRKLARR